MNVIFVDIDGTLVTSKKEITERTRISIKRVVDKGIKVVLVSGRDIIHTIEKSKVGNRDILLSALFYAMKECVFSKDGHMAQPLDLKKNGTRLLKQRSKDILEFFFQKCEEFTSEKFVETKYHNKVFNTDFEQLLEKDDVKDVTVIYADPPYTDMQYSRYYHLLNTGSKYALTAYESTYLRLSHLK